MIFDFFIKKHKGIEIIGDSKMVDLGENNHFHKDVIIDVSKGGEVKLGNGNHFFKGVMIMTYGGSIQIGNNCSFNPYTILYGHGGLKFGNDVRVAAQSMFIPANHVFEDLDTPIHKQGLSKKGININNNIWIGAGVKVLDGVTIYSGVVVAAGSVINSDLNENGIYGGVPGKLIKIRK